MTNSSDAGDEAILLPAKQVASLLHISQRTLWRLLSLGEIISPVRVGRSVRWRKDELMRWVSEGCPRSKKKR